METIKKLKAFPINHVVISKKNKNEIEFLRVLVNRALGCVGLVSKEKPLKDEDIFLESCVHDHIRLNVPLIKESDKALNIICAELRQRAIDGKIYFERCKEKGWIAEKSGKEI